MFYPHFKTLIQVIKELFASIQAHISYKHN